MGLLQANETIKLIIGKGEPLVGRLLLFEALTTQFTAAARCAATPRAARPAATASTSSDTEFEDYEALCAAAG